MKCYSCDKEKKLEVSVEDDDRLGIKKGRVKCWSCGANSIVELYCSITGEDEGVAKKILFGGRKSKDSDWPERIIFTNEVVGENPGRKERISDIIGKYDEIPLPMFTKKLTLDGDLQAIAYLEKRGINKEDIPDLGVYIPIFKTPLELIKLLNEKDIKLSRDEFIRLLSFSRRIIFPILINDRNYGYVARDYSGAPGRLKVLNSSGPLTYAFVYNFDVVKKSETLVINEGVFDSIKCGAHRSCALLGKAPSNDSDKMKILLQLNPEEVVVYLDNGAIPEAVRLCRLFSSKFLTKIVVTKPILNKNPSQGCFELVKKMVPFHYEDGHYLISPRNLALVKDFGDCIIAENPVAELAKKLKIDRYKKDKEYSNKLSSLGERFQKLSLTHKKGLINLIKEVKGWDFVDAGDRSLSENDRLIKEADVFNPNFDYEYIEKIYEF